MHSSMKELLRASVLRESFRLLRQSSGRKNREERELHRNSGLLPVIRLSERYTLGNRVILRSAIGFAFSWFAWEFASDFVFMWCLKREQVRKFLVVRMNQNGFGTIYSTPYNMPVIVKVPIFFWKCSYTIRNSSGWDEILFTLQL